MTAHTISKQHTPPPTPKNRVEAEKNSRALFRHFGVELKSGRKRETIQWVRSIPFLLMQLSPLAILWVGFSPAAAWTAFAFWFIRKFAITGFYHRYFSHKSFKTSRAFQAVMAFWGGMSVQKGALWWAAHHRDHHRFSDEPEDVHSPVRHGFLWSHMGWVLSGPAKKRQWAKVKELAKFPELRFLDKFHILPAVAAGALMFGWGELLEAVAPSWGTNGPQMLVWGFFVSTVVLYHTTYTINSLTHVFGSRRYETKDDSRNHWFFALITLGEGWHNNHHHYPSTARMGFFWWEIDVTYWGLWVLNKLGLIWDLRPVPEHVKAGQPLGAGHK